MDFAAKLNELFKTMNFSNVKVARKGGLDPSLISRFRRGDRLPSKSSSQILPLCRGIVGLAKETGSLSTLCSFCQISCLHEEDALVQQLCLWLSDTLPHKASTPPAKKPVPLSTAFSERFDALMVCFDISNIRLAKALHVDPSIISRYRTGMRVPPADSWLPKEICKWFALRVLSRPASCHTLLSPFLGEFLPQDSDVLAQKICNWLFEESLPGNQKLTINLLERIASFQMNPSPSPPATIEPLDIKPLRSGSKIYYGLKGLQEAVVQFLAFCALQSPPSTLYLYSDQNMDWMNKDPVFTKQWAALMTVVLQQGHHVEIIHNIDRSMEEMFEAIQKWIPLYMSGRIKSYYCKTPGDKRFSNTKFIFSEKISISASFIRGMEDQAQYALSLDPKTVNYQKLQFHMMCKDSFPLIQIFSLGKQAQLLTDLQGKFSFQDLSFRYLLPSLSIATMPEDVLEEILSRNGLALQDQGIRAYHAAELRQWEKSLPYGILELCAMAADESLFAGTAPVLLPAHLYGKALFYEADEYARHVAHIHHLLKAHPRYSFCPLPMSPFENISIITGGASWALTIKMDSPCIAFLFEHPSMCESFSGYLDSLQKKSLCVNEDRSALLQYLTRYLD